MLHLGSAGRYLCARRLSDYKQSLSWFKGISDTVISIVALTIIAAGVIAFTVPTVQVALGGIGGYVFLPIGVSIVFITLLIGLARPPKKSSSPPLPKRATEIDRRTPRPMLSQVSANCLTPLKKSRDRQKEVVVQNALAQELMNHKILGSTSIVFERDITQLNRESLKKAEYILGQRLKNNECTFYIHEPQSGTTQDKSDVYLLMSKLDSQGRLFSRHAILQKSLINIEDIHALIKRFILSDDEYKDSVFDHASASELLKRESAKVSRVNHIRVEWNKKDVVWPFIRYKKGENQGEALFQLLLKDKEITAYVRELTDKSAKGNIYVCRYHVVFLLRNKKIVIHPDEPLAERSFLKIALGQLPPISTSIATAKEMQMQMQGFTFISVDTLLADRDEVFS